MKDIKGFEDYTIYADGKVYSKKRYIFLSPRLRGREYRRYLAVALYDGNGKQKNIAVHRLVAEHFIDNPNNLPVVNHKDNNPLNNHVDNLEWVNYSDNVSHGYKAGRNRATKRIAQVDVKTDGVIQVFPSLQDAQNNTGIHYTAISKCLNGKQKSAGGYVWRFTDEN